MPDTDTVFYYFSVDAIGHMETEKSKVIKKDADDPPVDPNLSTTSHQVGVSSPNNNVVIYLGGAADSISGLDGYSVLWDTTPTTIPDRVKDLDASVVSTTTLLPDGTHYFHVSTLDMAGNWTNTAHIGPIIIDSNTGYVVPHGAIVSGLMESKTGGCLRCHKTDQSPSERNLLTESDEKEVCYTCHNGTGASTNIDEEFNGGISPVPVSRHPVSEGTMICSDCHSPHKEVENFDSTHTPNEVIKLLKVRLSNFIGYVVSDENISWEDTTTAKRLTDPKDMCSNCHGISSTLPGGDHLSDFKATSHDSSATSVTGISCFNCHSSHSSSLPALLKTEINTNTVFDNDNSVCFSCHALEGGGYSGQVAFESSLHHVSSSSVALTSWPGTSYEFGYCLNCHNPHGAAASDYRRAIDNDLCTTCHDAGAIPSVYSYRGVDTFDQTPHGDTGNADNVWPFPEETGQAIGQGGSTAGQCINCHDPHGKDDGTGNPYPKMGLRDGEDLCYGGGTTNCHASVTGSAAGIDINERFTANADPNSHHDVSDSDQAATGAKVECFNCHNPHLDTEATKTVDPDNRYSAFSGEVSQVTLYPLATFQPGAIGLDAVILGSDPLINFGSSEVMWVGRWSGQPARSIIEFDFTAIPAGATVSSALLSLPNSGDGSGADFDVEIHRNTASWDESLVTYNTAPPFDPTAIDSAATTNFSGWESWTATDLVQSWIDGTFSNYGMTVRSLAAEASPIDIFREYYSSEHVLTPGGPSTIAERPKLTITYVAVQPPKEYDYVDYCSKCHDGTTPSDVIIPLAVNDIFPRYSETSATGDKHGVRLGSASGYGELIGPYYYGMGAIACDDCHDPHGSSNAFGIRETINGKGGISIPPSTSLGVAEYCSSCHTYTHAPSPDCFSCHFHGASADGDPNTVF